jgi:L-amino acid N-acyltransferase YncA
MIRTARLTDAEEICAIYNHYVNDTVITFEEVPVPPDEMAKRIKEITESLPWLVYSENDAVKGYAYAGKWRTRSAYRHSVEATVYVHRGAVGKGIGTKLYTELLALLRRDGRHAALGCIALPNDASVALHEKLGFRKVAHFREVGLKFGKWIDVGYWQMLLTLPDKVLQATLLRGDRPAQGRAAPGRT